MTQCLASDWYHIRYLTQIRNLPFSTDMPHRFSAGSCVAIRWHPHGNTRIASVAMRGSSADLYNCPRMNVETYVLDWKRISIVESLQSRYRWGSIQWSAILSHASTLLFLYSASQVTSRHKWLSPFSARICTEFLSRFFRTVLCGKSKRVRADIRVHPRWKFEEIFGKV